MDSCQEQAIRGSLSGPLTIQDMAIYQCLLNFRSFVISSTLVLDMKTTMKKVASEALTLNIRSV